MAKQLIVDSTLVIIIVFPIKYTKPFIIITNTNMSKTITFYSREFTATESSNCLEHQQTKCNLTSKNLRKKIPVP